MVGTEAAGIGFSLSLVLTEFVLRSITWVQIKEAVVDSMRNTVTLLFILAGAKVFGKGITLLRIPHEVSHMLVTNIDSPAVFPRQDA